MDRTYILIIVVLVVLFGVALIIYYLSKRDEKNKKVIVFNRRRRELREIPESSYHENKTWEKIVTFNSNNIFEEFIQFLKRECYVNSDNKYIRKPSKGVITLKREFNKFIHELSKKQNR